jgi:hypothetical protein
MFWDAHQEKWYISIVDVIAILTESVDPTAYWRKLKQRLKAEFNQTVTNWHGLKMPAKDGKMLRQMWLTQSNFLGRREVLLTNTLYVHR